MAVQGLLIIIPTIKSLEKIKFLSNYFKTKMQKEVKKLVL